METSNNNDWERRRAKPKKTGWAKWLIRSQTLSILVTLGRLITFVVWLYHLIAGVLRE